MVSLKRSDMRILDDTFDMHGGYVLEFSNRTMSEFFEDELSIDIYQDMSSYNGASKAKHLRALRTNRTPRRRGTAAGEV